MVSFNGHVFYGHFSYGKKIYVVTFYMADFYTHPFPTVTNNFTDNFLYVYCRYFVWNVTESFILFLIGRRAI